MHYYALLFSFIMYDIIKQQLLFMSFEKKKEASFILSVFSTTYLTVLDVQRVRQKSLVNWMNISKKKGHFLFIPYILCLITASMSFSDHASPFSPAYSFF